MKSSPHALAATLAMLSLSAWAQVGDGPVPALTSPPSSPSAPPSTAVRPMSPALPAVVPRPPSFAPAAAAGAVRSTPEAREERRFLRDAAAQSRFELDASQLAFSKSTNPGVRTLAASMINHNQTIGLELAHLLNSRGMALPMLGDAQRKSIKQLARLSGSKLDSAYLQQVGLAQAGVARDYEKAAQVIGDPQVNGWIVKNQPTTRYHQMLAEKASSPAQTARVNRLAARPGLIKPPASGTPGVPAVVTVRPDRDAATVGFQPMPAAVN
jgi:putative membrane protein